MHKAVLLDETINGLDLKPNSVVFDGTLGAGGHSEEVFRRLGSKVKIIATDRDSEAIDRVKEKFQTDNRNFQAFLSDYRNIDSVLGKAGCEKCRWNHFRPWP